MGEKVIGILGGMGPEATLDCYSKIIQNTPASKDQQHLRVIIDSNPKIPDRTPAIIGDGQSPVPAIIKGCRTLERAGADFIIIPCVSAHFFLDEIKPQSPLPILSIIDATAEAIARDNSEIKVVGLIASTGTVKGETFQTRLADDGITTLVPDEHHQSLIMDAIYDIKNSHSKRSRADITAALIADAERLISQKPDGARGIIAGCTEIPLALHQKHLSVPYFDALTILARAAIREAGLTPVAFR